MLTETILREKAENVSRLYLNVEEQEEIEKS